MTGLAESAAPAAGAGPAGPLSGHGALGRGPRALRGNFPVRAQAPADLRVRSAAGEGLPFCTLLQTCMYVWV